MRTVAVTALRADLSAWIDKVRDGEEVVVTDRGTPVVRLVPVTAAPLIEQLSRSGAISKPVDGPRPIARGAHRVRASGPVADLVGELRAER